LDLRTSSSSLIDVINVYKRFLLKNLKNALLNVFILLTFFFNFQQVKVNQITFPDSSNIGNVLTIKNKGI